MEGGASFGKDGGGEGTVACTSVGIWGGTTLDAEASPYTGFREAEEEEEEGGGAGLEPPLPC